MNFAPSKLGLPTLETNTKTRPFEVMNGDKGEPRMNLEARDEKVETAKLV